MAELARLRTIDESAACDVGTGMAVGNVASGPIMVVRECCYHAKYKRMTFREKRENME